MAQVETFIIELKDVNVSKGLTAADTRVTTLRKNTTGFNKGLVTGMGKSGVAVDSLTLKVSRLRNLLLIGAFATAGVFALGSSIISTLSDFERFEAVLTNTLGSNSAAVKALENITEFAARTPFQVDKLTESFVRLANQNFTPTMNEMTKLGDLAAAVGKPFDQLSEAILDAMTFEFERLKEFGIKVKTEGDKLKFSFKGVETQIDKNSASIQQYILGLGELQGVSGAMAAISATTGGKLSNLSDQVTQLFLNIGENLEPAISAGITALSKFVGILSKLVDFLGENEGIVKGILTGFAVALGLWALHATVAAIATAVLTFQTWLLNGAMIANPIGLIIVAIGLLVAAVAIAWNEFAEFRGAIKGVWEIMKVVADNISEKWTSIPTMIIDAFLEIPKALADIFKGVGRMFEALMSGNFSDIPNIAADIGDAFLRANPLTAVQKKLFDEFTEGSGDAFDKAFQKEIDADLAEKKQRDIDAAGGIIGDGTGTGIGTGTKKSGLGSGISEIKTGAPKTFNINIGSLINDMDINTTTINESIEEVKEAVTKVLLTAVNDMQVISET